MKENLLAFLRNMLKSLGAVTLMIAVTLFSQGEGRLMGAVFIGYGTAAVYVWTMGYRIWRSAGLSVGSAKRQMLWGLLLRFVVLFAVLSVAIHISTKVFWATVSGFLIFYLLFLLHGTVTAYKSR